MRGGFRHIALPLGMALTLAGCGFADVHAPLPEFMRLKETEAPLEQPPDVRQLVLDHLDAVFVADSHPRGVRVSPPHREVRGGGWTACVRAEVSSSTTGKSIGVQTYRISISGGTIVDRRRVDADDNCDSESYEPI